MIYRSTDTEQFERQMEEFRDIIEDLDVKGWLENPNNICLVDDRGNIGLLDYASPGLYNVHCFFQDRGKDAIKHGRAMLKYAFHYDEVKVMRGLTPLKLIGARWFNRKMGMQSEGVLYYGDEPSELFILTKQMFNDKGQ